MSNLFTSFTSSSGFRIIDGIGVHSNDSMKYLENNAHNDNSVTICFKIILRFFSAKSVHVFVDNV